MKHPKHFHDIFLLLKKQGIDGLLLNSAANVSYAAGFRAPDSYAVIDRHSVTIVTDFRYAEDFKRHAKGPVAVIKYKRSIFDAVSKIAKRKGIGKLGFESRSLSFAECETLHSRLGKKFSFIPMKQTLEPLREVKTALEISRIKQAANITLRALAFAKKRLKPGRSELSIAADLERFIRQEGASCAAFETIVASGPNSSYPHARTSRKIIQEGEPVIIDMGVEYEGYKCDLTRTFFLGKIKPIIQRAARIVHQAQILAIKKIKPGVPARSIDLAARHFIEKQGFGKNFGHSLGHGVGLEIHEAPSINQRNPALLQEGMVFTVEPGIYVPGRFGIRMEETVLVTSNGVEVLSVNHRY